MQGFAGQNPVSSSILFCFVLSQLADTVNAPSYFHHLHCRPCVIHSASDAIDYLCWPFRSSDYHEPFPQYACRRIVRHSSFTVICLIAVATNCRFVIYTLIMPGGSMAVAIVPRTFSDDYTSAFVCASCHHFLRCLRFSGNWNKNAIIYPIPCQITWHNYFAEPK